MLVETGSRIVRGTLDLICPRHCCLCHHLLATSQPAWMMFCDDCHAGLIDRYDQACGRCGSPIPQVLVGQPRCGRCYRSRFAFLSVTALGIYADQLRDAVIAAKHRDVLAMSLGALLSHQRRDRLTGLGADVVVAVPMHWSRRFVRGVNAAELLASAVARGSGLRRLQGLVGRRQTVKQGTLTRSARLTNVRGAFRAVRHSRLAGRRVLLVDDVMTTGATAHEAARTLLAVGVESVQVAVVARGIGRST